MTILLIFMFLGWSILCFLAGSAYELNEAEKMLESLNLEVHAMIEEDMRRIKAEREARNE